MHRAVLGAQGFQLQLKPGGFCFKFTISYELITILRLYSSHMSNDLKKIVWYSNIVENIIYRPT